MTAIPAAGTQDVPPVVTTTPVENKKNCSTCKQAGTIAAVVGGIALAALAAFAYIKGYMNPVIEFFGSVLNSIVGFATQSPLHTVAVVVGVVGLVALGIFLGKLAVDAINKKCDKAAPVVEENKPAVTEKTTTEESEVVVDKTTEDTTEGKVNPPADDQTVNDTKKDDEIPATQKD